MAERLFGMETEYGFAVTGPTVSRSGRLNGWCERFMQVASSTLKHLPAASGAGFFLTNGARFYIDGCHPEMTTPECANPWDVVRYVLAGEQVLLQVAAEMRRRERGITDLLLFKTNVDHGGTGATWGCHTSFLHRTSPEAMPAQIIPHLVSRIIYTGAGGIEPVGDGWRFTVSPRVAFLQSEIASDSTNERGIYHTRDETLSAEGFHRLHIISGESLCSETAVWLNMGVTALIVTLVEIGATPGHAVQLRNPLAAMRWFASDPTCTATVAGTQRRRFSAVQIQRHYLEQVEANLHHPLMPPWAAQICREWRRMLDRLENGAPASVAATLDWAIKFLLFSDRLARRGSGWKDPATCRIKPLLEEDEARKIPPYILALERRDLFAELCEIDTRFGQLGDRGIFTALDRAGALAHRVPGVDNIEHAVAHPPEIGRARLRGECVRRLAGENGRYMADWNGIYDMGNRRFLDLTRPFEKNEQWKSMPRRGSLEEILRMEQVTPF